ncbi:MAG: LysR family transcriptional regulator [Cellvibrionaceae bacterium]
MILSTLPLTFVAIVETGSITKAAESLKIAKSAVSQNLKRLEEQLDVKLAARTTRQLSLTPAGQRYYKRCKDMLALANQASTEMEDFGATPAGTVTITAPHTLIAPILAPAMSQVTQRFPKLRPMLIADDSRLDLVANGIDLAISVGNLPDSNLKARRIGEMKDILCVHPDILKDKPKNNENALLDWLQSLPYVSHVREDTKIKHTLVSNNTQKIIHLNFQPTFTSNTIEGLASFARAGIGVALLPEPAIKNDLENNLLAELLPNYTVESVPIYAVHVYDTLPPVSVLEIIRAIEAQLKNFKI